jgi:hypothetical protein
MDQDRYGIPLYRYLKPHLRANLGRVGVWNVLPCSECGIGFERNPAWQDGKLTHYPPKPERIGYSADLIQKPPQAGRAPPQGDCRKASAAS